MPPPNPLGDAQPSSSSPTSMKTFHIAGILTDVYGLDELPPACKSVSCLWLLHPRLQTRQVMASVAITHITDWNRRASAGPEEDGKVGVIAVSFDQRNHGTREVNALSNQAWREGNDNHAQDMFSIIHGTAVDTSLLIDYLGSYVLNGPEDISINQHLVMGISLGGHSAWQVLFNDPRVSAAVVVIGCPDYTKLISDRARLSKRASYTSSDGSAFLGSTDFPRPLISTVQGHDPKGILFGTSAIPTVPLTSSEQGRLRPILASNLSGKRVLVCSGGDDKLVPYYCSEPLLQFLKNAAGGWWGDGDFAVEDIVYPGVGHAYSEGMVRDTTRFVSDLLASKSAKLESKI